MSRRSSRASLGVAGDAELKVECKAAYLSVFNDIHDEIRTEEDLISVLQQAGRNPSRKTIRKYWNEDVDRLTYDDFVDICRREHPTSRDDLLKAFKKIDLNGDGFISEDELFKLLTTKGEKMSRHEVRQMLDDVDENKDGKLDYEEFCNMVMKTTEECKKLSLRVMEKKERKKTKPSRTSAAKTEEERVSKVSLKSQADERTFGSRTSLRSADNKDVQTGLLGAATDTYGKEEDEPKSIAGSRTSLKEDKKSLFGPHLFLKQELEQESLTGSRTSLKNDAKKESVSRSRVSLRGSISSSRRSVREDVGDGETSGSATAQRMDEGDETSGSRATLKAAEEGEGGLSSSRTSMQSQGAKPKGVNVATSRTSLKREKLLRQGQEETPAQLEKSASQISLKSTKSAKDERTNSSQISLRSASLGGSRQSLLSVDDLPKPNPRSKKRLAVAGKVGRIPEPSSLREWTHTKSRGCFFIDSDDGEVISHQYRLILPMEDRVWITMQPITIGDAGALSDTPVDTAIFIFRAKRGETGSFVACTEQRDGKGKYYLECRLDAGEYHLVPFTTRCRFKPRSREPPTVAKLVKKKDGHIALTAKFKKSLEDIFDMMDLDGNGLLSREEFSWFNMRTSGEEVADEEWEVVEGNVDLENGQIPKDGFIKLNEMEAEDNEGDEEELWVTLNNMGFNKSLILDEACPFQLDIHTENCDDAELTVHSLDSRRDALDSAVCKLALDKGVETKLKSVRDASVYTYLGEARASIVLENRGSSSAEVGIDCSKSSNVMSNIGPLETSVRVPRSSQEVVFHLVPEDERQEWSVRCHEK